MIGRPVAKPWAVGVSALLLAVVCGCGPRRSAPSAPPDLDRLLGLMQRRLALMHDVARWKWNERRAITDRARERELLDRVAERATARGLDEVFVRSFFAAQIEAAKLVQQADFDRWRLEGQGPFPDAPDLVSLRAQIDELNQQLLDALAAAGPLLGRRLSREAVSRRAEQVLSREGITPAVRETAIAPLLGR